MRALLFVALVACGGRSSTPQHPDPTTPPPRDANMAPEPPPSAADCDALIAHAVALAAAGQPKATDDDQAKAREDLQAQYGASCRQMSRAHYLCALSAPTLDSMAECAADSHATRSSSTSNSSVAFGGMTPAAPRSP